MQKHKTSSVVAAFCAAVLALVLVACGGSSTTYGQELLTEVSGIKVTAQNAYEKDSATTDGALEVKAGDIVGISPDVQKGAFHLTITSADGKTVAFDDDVSGSILFTITVEPGTYSVKTTGKAGTTGWMTVFVQSADELSEQNAALADELQKNGLDPSIANLGNETVNATSE